MGYIKNQNCIILTIDYQKIVKYIYSLTQYIDHQVHQLHLDELFDSFKQESQQCTLQCLISHQLISVLQDRHVLYRRIRFFIEKIKTEDCGNKKDFAILFNLFDFFKRMLSKSITIAISIELIFDQKTHFAYRAPQDPNKHMYFIKISSSAKPNIQIEKFYHECKTMFCFTEIDRQFINEIEEQENLLKNHLIKSGNIDFDFLFDKNINDIEKTKKLLELTDFCEYIHHSDIQDVMHTLSSFYLIFLHHEFSNCHHATRFLKFIDNNINERENIGKSMNNALQEYCRSNNINALNDIVNIQDYMNNIKCCIASLYIEIADINDFLDKMSADNVVDADAICKIIKSYINDIKNYINQANITIDNINLVYPRFIVDTVDTASLNKAWNKISYISDLIENIDLHKTVAKLKNALQEISNNIYESSIHLQCVIKISNASCYMVEEHPQASVLFPESDLYEANAAPQEELLYISF